MWQTVRNVTNVWNWYSMYVTLQ